MTMRDSDIPERLRKKQKDGQLDAEIETLGENIDSAIDDMLSVLDEIEGALDDEDFSLLIPLNEELFKAQQEVLAFQKPLQKLQDGLYNQYLSPEDYGRGYD